MPLSRRASASRLERSSRAAKLSSRSPYTIAIASARAEAISRITSATLSSSPRRTGPLAFYDELRDRLVDVRLLGRVQMARVLQDHEPRVRHVLRGQLGVLRRDHAIV